MEVADPNERKVNLGTIEVNEKLKRAVRIINNSLTTIDFNLTITPSMQLLQNNSVLSISLKPQQTTDVIVIFQPRNRIPKFCEEVRHICYLLVSLLCYCSAWLEACSLPLKALKFTGLQLFMQRSNQKH